MSLNKIYIVIIAFLLVFISFQTINHKKITKGVNKKTNNELSQFKKVIKNIFSYRTKRINNVLLTSSKGKKIEVSKLLKEHNSEKLLILYSPSCVCQIEKEKALFQSI